MPQLMMMHMNATVPRFSLCATNKIGPVSHYNTSHDWVSTAFSLLTTQFFRPKVSWTCDWLITLVVHWVNQVFRKLVCVLRQYLCIVVHVVIMGNNLLTVNKFPVNQEICPPFLCQEGVMGSCFPTPQTGTRWLRVYIISFQNCDFPPQ